MTNADNNTNERRTGGTEPQAMQDIRKIAGPTGCIERIMIERGADANILAYMVDHGLIRSEMTYNGRLFYGS